MSNRTSRIVKLARDIEDVGVMARLQIPNYESTKGTNRKERSLAIANVRDLQINPNKNQETGRNIDTSQKTNDNALSTLEVSTYENTMDTSQMEMTLCVANEAQLTENKDIMECNYMTIQNYDCSNLDLSNIPIVIIENISEMNTDGNIFCSTTPQKNSFERTGNCDTKIDESNTIYNLTSKLTLEEPNRSRTSGTDSSISIVESSVIESSGTEYLPSDTTVVSEEFILNAPDFDQELPLTCLATELKNTVTRQKNVKSDIKKTAAMSKLATTKDITIKPTFANDLGIRVKDKVHCCYFCNKFIQQMAIHFEKRHCNEPEVARLLAMPKKSKPRRDGFGVLIRIGDFHNNCEVIEKKEGEFILVRKPNQNSTKHYTQYGPCPRCLGFFLKELLWHHMKYSCKNSENGTNKNSNALSESNALMASTVGRDNPQFYEHIVAKFKNDTISLTCKQDSLINRFGRLQFEKYHTIQTTLIRQTMRQLARLLIQLRTINPLNPWLANWLKPEFFDDIVSSIKFICKFNPAETSRPQFNTPSLALKLGHALRKCVAIEKGFCIRRGDVAGLQRLTSFLTLMDLEWSIRVSSNALNTLHIKKINSVELLPVTEDLVKLNTFLNNKISFYKKALALAPTKYEEWRKLAMNVLCKIVLFNKRRSGEAARMTVINYTTRPNWSQVGTSEYKESMSALELKLASSLSLVQIIGKRNRIVSILLTNDVKEAIELLLETRSQVNIPEDNIFLFAAGGGSVSHLRGHDALRICCSEADLIRPDLINSTKLRKYIATVSQIFNLSENETDWLARHLGHDIRVHRDFYRLHDSSIELTKISRILMAVEKGEANKFAGKTLNEIAITDLPDIEDQDIQSDEETEEDTTQVAEIDTAESTEETFSSCDEFEKENYEKEQTHKKKKKGKITNNNKQTRKAFKKKLWSAEETKVVLEFFRNEIKQKNVPGKNKCEDCIKQSNDTLSTRSWKDVKYHVKNQIAKINIKT